VCGGRRDIAEREGSGGGGYEEDRSFAISRTDGSPLFFSFLLSVESLNHHIYSFLYPETAFSLIN
jgi:hypothetical protein